MYTKLVYWASIKKPEIGDGVDFLNEETVEHVPLAGLLHDGILETFADSVVVSVQGDLVEVLVKPA